MQEAGCRAALGLLLLASCILLLDCNVRERRHTPSQRGIEPVEFDDDGIVDAALAGAGHGRDASDAALQRLALERVEGDVDGLADGDVRHIHFAQVGGLDAERGQVAEREDGLSRGEHFAFAGVDVADRSGEGRCELQLVEVGLGQIGSGLRLGDVGLGHGDLFLGGPGHYLIEPRLSSYTTDSVSEPHCFETLPPGSYPLTIKPPANYASTTFDAMTINLSGGMKADVMYGARRGGPAPAPTRAVAASDASATPGGLLGNTGRTVLIVFAALVLVALGGAVGVALMRRR